MMKFTAGPWACVLSGVLALLVAAPASGQCEFVGPQPLPDLILNNSGAMVQSVKNRFLSFSVPADTDPALKAVRVKIVDLWGRWSVLNGTIKWVGAPIVSTESSGLPLVEASPAPTFLSAPLVDAPVFLDWTVFDMVHVWDEWIVPSRRFSGQVLEPATYWIQTVREGCVPDLEESFSSPLVVTQALWADIGSLAAGEFVAADGEVGVADILALLAKFSAKDNAPSKARVEMLGVVAGPVGTIDGVTSVSDILAILGAFAGGEYPFDPFPPDYPFDPSPRPSK